AELAHELDMNAVEFAATRLVQDANEVDDHRRAPRQPRKHGFIVYVGLDDVDGRKQNQMFGALALPGRNDDPPSGGDQSRYQVPTDETAATEHQRRSVAHGESFVLFPERSGTSSTNVPFAPLGVTTPRRSRSATYGSPSCA